MNMKDLTETEHRRLASAILSNPLSSTGEPGNLMRLCLAMAIGYGMPPQVAATLDDLAAMFGFYALLATNQQRHLTAPLVTWRTDPKQPLMDIVDDVGELALKQRALIAFGGYTPGHMVGTAEIVFAMGNTHPDITPDNWVELFQWAATDVLSGIKQIPPDDVRNLQKWLLIEDKDVIEPGGRLHETYNLVATTIRREAIAVLQGEPERDLRQHQSARELAANFRALYRGLLTRAEAEETEEAQGLRKVIANIERIYPHLDDEPATAEAETRLDSLLDARFGAAAK